MTDTTKSEWIALLKKQLLEAEKREQSWQLVGEQLQKTKDELWKAVAEQRRLETELFRALIKKNEGQG